LRNGTAIRLKSSNCSVKSKKKISTRPTICSVSTNSLSTVICYILLIMKFTIGHRVSYTFAHWALSPPSFGRDLKSERQISSFRESLRVIVIAWRLLKRSEEHTSELQSRENLVCRLLLEKKKKKTNETAQH